MAIHTTINPDLDHEGNPNPIKKLDKKKWWKTTAGKIGIGVTALLTGGTVVTGVVYNATKGPEPTTSAAGPQHPGQESVKPTTPEVFAPKDKSDIDLATFPFVIDGKTYEGQQAFMQACEVSTTEYPTAQEAMPALLNKLNSWTKAGQNQDEFVRYDNYFPEGEKYATLPAVVDSIYNPAYEQCLGAAPEQSNAFLDDVATRATDNSVAWILSNNNGDSTPYTAEYTADTENIHLENPGSSIKSGFNNIQLDYSDNGDQNSVGKQRVDKHWQGIGTAKDYYSSTISGNIAVKDGHWTLTVTSQHFLESSRPME